MASVLQPWLTEIPVRMQSTLLLSLRGPDTHRCPEIKRVQRWMRGLAFVPGNPDNVREFMNNIDNVPELHEKNDLARELEFSSQHFYSHLMHGLQVLAAKHPTPAVRHKAAGLYEGMCSLFHLRNEPYPEFLQRLGHRVWPYGQPSTFEEAVAQLERRCAERLQEGSHE